MMATLSELDLQADEIPILFDSKESIPFLFEIAWEVANKGELGNDNNSIQNIIYHIIVGGICTVLKTKSPITIQEYGDRYVLMGPWMQNSAQIEVEVLQPSDPVMAAVIESMAKARVQVIFGRWLIEGYPHVVLFDLGSSYHRLNEWKTDLWDKCHISTPPSDQETNDAVVFGYLVAWFLGEVGDGEEDHIV
jgi:glycogen synthase